MTKPLFDYFNIAFAGDSATDENGRKYAIGWITFGASGEPETMAAYLDCWSEDKYVEQWNRGIRRIVEQCHTASCLIVSVQPDEYGSAIETWEMHREGPRVIFRYVIHAPVLSGKRDSIDPERIYDEIKSRHDHEDASEWHVALDALISCLHRLSQ